MYNSPHGGQPSGLRNVSARLSVSRVATQVARLLKLIFRQASAHVAPEEELINDKGSQDNAARCRLTGALVAAGLASVLALCMLSVPALRADEPSRETPEFERTIAPLVIRQCIACHNPSEASGGLDLSQQSTALAGGESGPALVPGAPRESLLVERVAEGSMPPRGKGNRLSPDEVALLTAWVQGGADWPEGRKLSPFELTTDRRAGFDWWSLNPIVRPPVQEEAKTGWARTPIDRFILQQLVSRGIVPSPAADRTTFIRRVAFDLLGLPPEPEEIEAFVSDTSGDAYERLIDRLLASPHYGERWGRHWLDVARFGESDGFENDKLRPDAWPYRDYVIRSFNEDRPYDQFVREQLAGDVLSPITRDGIAASGFLVAGSWDEVQNVAKSPTERLRAHEEQMEELVAAVSQGFLGLTVNCSRCHDHKFDPIPQTDYYRLKAVFEGVDHGRRALLTPEEQSAHDAVVQPLAAQTQALKQRVEDLKSRAGMQIADTIPENGYIAGRFDETFDPRKTQLALRSKPVWHAPPLTVECWARLNSKAGFNILVANNLKESSEHWELYTYAGSGEFSVYLPGFQPAEIKSGIDITDGTWHYVAWTFDGKRAGLFIDGRQVADVAVERQRSGGPVGALHFAAYPPGKIGCDGLVDEVRISRVLRPIRGIPDGPFAPDEQTLGLWHFDAREEGKLRDFTPRPAAGNAPAGVEETPPEQLQEQLAAASRELQQLEAELAKHPLPQVYSGVRRQPDPTTVFLRGDIRKPGPTVAPGGLSAVRTLTSEWSLSPDTPEAERRIRFAEWVASDQNPLTARVIVNRLWQQHFGQGLVEMPSDIGFHGGAPSHPELLDWLAAELISPSGPDAMEGVSPPNENEGKKWRPGAWSLKRLHRLILLSATYRQSAQFNPEAAAVDSDNRLLWRFAPRRLEAESVR
ncbi:MAG: DUF1549 domain-containing protein, partial [Planctomycetales bacterium]